MRWYPSATLFPRPGRTSDPGSTLLSILAGTLLILLGGYFSISNLMTRQRQREARDWTETTCLIESSTLLEYGGGEDASPSFEPAIRYRLTVDSITYYGDRFAFWRGAMGEGAARAIVDRYPPGHPVRCFYDSRTAAISVLDREGTIPITELVIGLGMLASGVAVCVWCRSIVWDS